MVINKMILDVHNLSLNEAIDEILYKFDECKECGEDILQIIHGHKHGTIIRDYIRSIVFISEMAKNGNEFLQKSFSQEGVSIFKIKLSVDSSKREPILKSSSIERKDGTVLSLNTCYKCNEKMILLKEFNWFQCPKCGKLKKR
jgi:Zn finger protein HypA/HybF involved in hydrogenase expression